MGYTKKPVNPRGAGRKTKLDSDLMDKIIKAVAAGNYIETAVRMNGICKQTLYNWLERGNKVTEDSPREEWIYAELVDKLQQALAFSEIRDMQHVYSAAAAGAWQAAAWRLERRNPKMYGRPRTESGVDMYDQVSVGVTSDDPVKRAVDDMLYAFGGDDINDGTGDGEE